MANGSCWGCGKASRVAQARAKFWSTRARGQADRPKHCQVTQMNAASDIEPFPRLEKWLVLSAASSPSAVVGSVKSMLDKASSLERTLPLPYVWLFQDQDTLDEAVRNAKTPGTLNSVLWENVGRNCEAFQITSTLKGLEVLKATIRSLNSRQFVSSAVLARAALEHAAFVTDKVTYILKNFRLLEFRAGAVTMSPEFEAEVLRMTFGTRLQDGQFKDLPRQTNCLNAIDRLSRSLHPEHQELQKRYAFLCELIHPNVLGNARFWSNVEGTDDVGRQRLVIRVDSESDLTIEITEYSLWALSWSSGMLFQAFQDMEEAKVTLVRKLLQAFPGSVT